MDSLLIMANKSTMGSNKITSMNLAKKKLILVKLVYTRTQIMLVLTTNLQEVFNKILIIWDRILI
jgi:hypothetical protein